MYLLLQNNKPIAAYEHVNDIQIFINKEVKDNDECVNSDLRLNVYYVWTKNPKELTRVFRIVQLALDSRNIINDRLDLNIPYYKASI
jgi:hypothetical protein